MRSRAGLLAAVVLATGPRAVGAQVPLGSNFQVNSYTTGDQAFPSVASDPNGGFVVVWNSVDQDGSGYGIFARRYDAAGDGRDAADFPVNAYTLGNQSRPAVAANPSGMVVVWHSTVRDGSGHGVYARRFDAAGAPLGAEFRVNTYTTGDQNDARVALDDGGAFVVVWTSLGQDGAAHGVFGQRYDEAGAPQGGELRIHSHTTGSQTDAAVAADAAGNFVVVWHSAGQDGDGGGIFGQRFDAAGLPQSDEFRVNEHTTGNQAKPAVAADDTGGFTVVWASFGQDGAGDGVFARRYGADGFPRDGEFQVNAYTTGFQGLPSVSADPAGFTVTWTSEVPEDRVSAIIARRYGAAGAPQGGEFRVNTFTPGYQIYPAVAASARGDFVIAWMSAEEDGSLWGVFGQRFAPDVIFADGFESGDLAAWSAAATDGGDLAVFSGAALDSTTAGLRATVDDTNGLYVQDDSPNDEDRYRARYYFDPNGFDPGEGQAHRRTRIFIAFEENPNRRLFAVVLRRQGGAYAVMARARLDDDSQRDTAFVPISDDPHWVELDWRRASGPDANDGAFEFWVDGTSVFSASDLDNSVSAVDFARMGALSVKSGASGTLYWDEFESRRMSPIGP